VLGGYAVLTSFVLLGSRVRIGTGDGGDNMPTARDYVSTYLLRFATEDAIGKRVALAVLSGEKNADAGRAAVVIMRAEN
jgi:hypothetical protein